eukprot:SAG25_NODE_1384_length_3154_cov_2.977741_3_plen_281_part_00
MTPQDELDLPPPPPPPERAYQCSSRHLYDHRLSGRGDANSTSLPPSASAVISSSLSAPPSSVADDATAGVGASSSVPSRAWRLTHSDDEAEAPAVPVRGADDGMHLILNRKLPSNGRLSKTSTTCTPCSMHASTRLTRTRVLHANMHAPEAASLSSARSGCAPTPLVFPLCLEQPACLHPCKADGTIPLPCVLRLLCGVSTHASVTRVARAHARVYDLSDAPTRGATTSPTGSAPRVRPTSEVFNPAMLASTSLDHRSKHIKYASAATFPYHTAHVRGGG